MSFQDDGIVGPMLEAISAHVDGEPCCTHIGPDGSGHFVKMVHNGIEYADMQFIGEAYEMLRAAGFSLEEIAQVFETWEHRAMTTFSEGGEYDPEAAWADFSWVANGATDSGAAGTAMATGSKTR